MGWDSARVGPLKVGPVDGKRQTAGRMMAAAAACVCDFALARCVIAIKSRRRLSRGCHLAPLFSWSLGLDRKCTPAVPAKEHRASRR